MTSFTARDGAGRSVSPATPESLRPFLEQCARERAGYVVLFSDPALPTDASRSEADADRREAQLHAEPLEEGGWTVRVEAPGSPAQYGRAPNTDAVFDICRSWAADDGWWSEAFSWILADDASDESGPPNPGRTAAQR